MESQKRRFERAVHILRVISEATSPDPRKLPNKYEICRTLGSELGTEPTILAAITEQESAGHIRPAYVDKHARGGTPSKHYQVTFQGFKVLLAGVRELGWKGVGFREGTCFSTLACRHRQFLPEIFPLWQKFEEQGIANLIEQELHEVADEGGSDEFEEKMQTAKRWKTDWLKEDKSRRAEDYPPAELEKGWVRHFMDILILFIETGGAEKRMRFLKAVSNDPDIRKIYLDYLNRKKAEEVDYLNRIEAQIQAVSKS